MSNLGAWAHAYEHITAPLPYGDEQTYVLAAWWMEGCAAVEDWGCGGGALRGYLHPSQQYVGIDASPGPYTDIVGDVADRQEEVDGIVIRHVLEHEPRWPLVLDNALTSFARRLCVIVFTPLVGLTHQLATEVGYGDAPTIAFSLDDLREPFRAEPSITHDVCTLSSPWSHYGVETLIYAQRA